MGAIASQITSLMIVYSTVYSDADQRKHESSASLAYVRGIHRGTVKCFHLMTSSLVVSSRWGTMMKNPLMWIHLNNENCCRASCGRAKCIVGLCLVLLYKTPMMAWRWPSGMVDCLTHQLARHPPSSICSLMLVSNLQNYLGRGTERGMSYSTQRYIVDGCYVDLRCEWISQFHF